MSSVFPGPSGAFEAHIKLTLSALGVEETPSWLLAGVIMNIMVPMVKTTSAQLKVNPITSWIVLSLRNEISTLCAAYHIDNVEFHFDSPLDAPEQLIDDFFALNISGSMLSKNPSHWKSSNFTAAEAQVLLNFLALVRALMHSYDSYPMAEVIADYNNKVAVPLPSNHLRHPGVGPRVVNVYRNLDAPAPPMATRTKTKAKTKTKSNMRFNPFASCSRPVAVRRVHSRRFDLDDECSPGMLSDAPLRMRRRGRGFGLGRF